MMKQSLKILWVKSGPLFPLDSGGKKRTHAMLREIQKVHEVTYLALLDEGITVSVEERNADYAATKEWIPWKETRKQSFSFFCDLLKNLLFSSLPYALEKYVCAGMRDRIRELDTRGGYDLIICDFLFPAPNVRGLKLKTPTVLFQHNMEAQIWDRMQGNQKNPIGRFYFGLQRKRMRNLEQSLSDLFDGVITVSEDDTEYARREYGAKNVLGHVPTGVDMDFFQPQEMTDRKSGRLAFLGSMDWMPNIEGVKWFLEYVYAGIRGKVASVSFYVIGRNPPPSLLRFEEKDSSVSFSGTVSDVRPCIGGCQIMVVPLLSGGGTRIKILEAMALGIPVISTTIGAEGLGLTPGVHFLVADTPEDYVRHVADLVVSPEKGELMSRLALKYVQENLSWSSATNEFLRLCRPILTNQNSAE
jgi:glycosyltransferase involved in cell wall biosynthesis